MICFADLKKYKFTYLFALHSDVSWKLVQKPGSDADVDATSNDDSANAKNQLTSRLTTDETTALVDCVQTWRYSVDARQYGFFLAKKSRAFPQAKESLRTVQETPPLTPGTPSPDLNFNWVIGSLRAFEEGFFDAMPQEDCFICFADPSTYPTHPGWMLRNLLVLVRRRWNLDNAQILCYRDTQSRRHEARSIILSVESSWASPHENLKPGHDYDMPRVTGWERGSAGRVASKVANLGDYMNPQRYRPIPLFIYRLTNTSTSLADQAVDLNLKLIKWRIAPNLNLDIIRDTKCLLLGAGTLGSYVARNLLVR